MNKTNPATLAALRLGDIELSDTTRSLEAQSIRVIDALPRKVQSAQFLNDGYVIAKCYGPDRETYSNLFVAAPELYTELQKSLARESAMTAIISEAYERFTDNDMIPSNHKLSVWLQKATHVLKPDWQDLAQGAIAKAEGLQ